MHFLQSTSVPLIREALNQYNKLYGKSEDAKNILMAS